MNIKEITNQSEWTTFFNSVGSVSFHQSWEWGEFQKKLHYDILRLGLYEDNSLIGIALVIKVRSKRGRFLFVPHGPIFDIPATNLSIQVSNTQKKDIEAQLKALTEHLTTIARREGFWFIRVAPTLSDSPEHLDLFRSVRYHTAPIYMHAETMWAVDLRQSEEQLLNGMRKNTRYYVRRGIKEGITISKSDDISALEEFWKLYEVTFTREDFTPFSKSYIKNEFDSFHKTQNSLFILGGIPPKSAQEGASQILAGSLVIFTKSTAFYHQGASIHSEFPVPYQIQWQTMIEAKRRGCSFYNLYGIYKPGRTPKAWEGLSLFKKGFGGFQVDYLPTQDFVVSPSYYFSYCVDKYIAWRRGI